MSWGEFALVFGAGVVSGVALAGGVWLLRRYLELRRARIAAEVLRYAMSDNPQDREAQLRVAACKQRLRWQATLNPSWLSPLLDEVPTLVRDIATVYYPDAEDPVRAPGLSHFMRAIHLTAEDIANFLQTHRLGRLVDVSTHTLWKSWATSQRIARHEHVKTLHIWYRHVYPWHDKTRPIWQALRYRSPWMWMSFAASNVAVRTLQPMMIDIMARRAIELYSGRLAARSVKPVPPLDEAKPIA